MTTIFAVIHVLVCLLLIALVLLQDPKSSGGGGIFGGGGSSSLLGATGAVTFLTRLTRYSAIIFGITCLVLTLLSRPNTGSVLDTVPASQAAPPTNIPTNPGSPVNAAPAPGAASAPAPGTTSGPAPQAPAEQAPANPAPATK